MRSTWVEPTDTPDVTQANDYQMIGRDFAEHAMTRVFEDAKIFCECGKVRIAKSDEPEITRLRARLSLQVEQRDEAKTLLSTKPALDLAALGHKRRFYLVITVVLLAVGTFLAHVSVAPFGLGWEAWPLSVGLALVGAMGLSMALEEIQDRRFVLCLAVAAAAASLIPSAILGALRADVFAFNLNSAISGPTDDTGNSPSLAVQFYQHARPELGFALVLLAIATDLVAGYTLHKFWTLHLAPEKAYETAQKTVTRLEQEMPEALSQAKSLQNRPDVWAADFRSGFQKRCLELSSRTWLLGLVALAIPTLAADARAQSLEVLIGLDLTGSVSARGYDEQSAYQENCRGALRVISQLPPGARVTAAAITDHSFASPLILVSGQVAAEHGPLALFDQRAASRQKLASALARQCASRKPVFKATDVLGFLSLGAELLQPSSGKKMLIIFSDMRQAGDGLDFDRPSHLKPDQLRRALRLARSADLKGMDVYVLGADALGKDVAYWNELRSFWQGYFTTAGASLREYSLARDCPDLSERAR